MNRRQLELITIPFCGRKSELEQLADIYQTAKDKNVKGPKVIVVSGYSGSGKTTLVLRGLSDTVKRFGGFFCCGKFDQRTSLSRPYAAIVDALTELFHQLDTKVHGSMIEETLEEEDIVALADVFPSLLDLIPSSTNNNNNNNQNTLSRLEWGFERLKILLRKILGTLCNPAEPIVVFFDDLQWSDPSTLDFIADFACKLQANGFIMVISYRNNEVSESHPLAVNVLKHLDPERTTKICLSSLPFEPVQQIVSSLLGLDAEVVQPLADVVFTRTHGNVFFVIQLLKDLEQRGLLHYNRLIARWEWDTERIKSDTNISENVVDLISGRISELPEQLKTILLVGACMSRWLDLDVLSYILSNGDFTDFSIPPTNDDIQALLENAVEECLIHVESEARYRFSHDRIQQGAYLQVHEDMERTRLHLKIGRLLHELHETRQCEEWIFFVTVDQLDRGALLIDNPDERRELARLNLLVAQKLSAKSAFFAATDYLEKGIELLGNDVGWCKDFELCLELHTFSLEMEFCCGNFERCKERVDIVIKKSPTLNGKMRSYFKWVQLLGTQRKFAESLSLGRDVLMQLGESWPKKISNYHILKERLKVNLVLKGMSDDKIRSLPIMEKGITSETFKMFTALSVYSWCGGDAWQAILLSLRMLRFTLTEGLCDLSGFAFSWYAMACIAFKDLKSGLRFRDLALWACKKFNATGQECTITVNLEVFVSYLTKPVTHSLDRFLHAYRVGLKTGDVFFAFSAAACYIIMYFFSGLPLPTLAVDAEGYIAQMKEYTQNMCVIHASAFLQCALNLMGQSNYRTKLCGAAFDMDKLPQEAIENPHSSQVIHLASLQLALYFYDWKKMLETAELLFANKDMSWPTSLYQVQCFYVGLAWYALARKTGKTVYKKRALHATKTIEKWVKWGMTSAYHMMLVLSAERVALKADVESTKLAYDDAIKTVARSGYTHIEALLNERCGEFFRNKGDEQRATFYLNRAQGLYEAWGAMAKVNDMEIMFNCTEMSRIFFPNLTFRTSIKGSSQFSDSFVEEHKNRDLISLGNVKSNSKMPCFCQSILKNINTK